MTEFLVLAAILAIGSATIRCLGFRGWALGGVGFAAGTFLIIVSGAVLAVTGLPVGPRSVLAVAAAPVVALLILRRPRPDNVELVSVATGLALLLVATAMAQVLHPVGYHIDSFRYLAMSGLLAQDALELATDDLWEKRLLAAPVVHSLANLYGEDYLRAFSPVLMVSLLVTLAWTTQRWWSISGPTSLGGRRQRGWALAIGLLLLVSNNRMVWNSFYLNDHLIAAVGFLVACAVGLLLMAEDREATPALVVLAGLALASLVVTRAEGFLIAGLAVLPLALSTRAAFWARAVPVGVLGVATAGWFTSVSLTLWGNNGAVSLTTLGPALVGAVTLLSVPALRGSRLVGLGPRLLLVVELALWGALGFFVVRDPSILVDSVSATVENVAFGAGSWGASFVILVALLGYVIALNSDRVLVALRFPLTALLPVLFLLAYLRDAAYRVGNGDSLNRMLMQFVPVMVLYLLAAVGSSDWRVPPGHRGRPDMEEGLRVDAGGPSG